MSSKQTRGGASIKLVPLDSPMHGPILDPLALQCFLIKIKLYTVSGNKLEGVPA